MFIEAMKIGLGAYVGMEVGKLLYVLISTAIVMTLSLFKKGEPNV